MDYGTGFGYSLLPYITVLEFRNAITVVAKEETRVNYQYLTVSPSESCELTQLTDITVNNGCDWVSSIFVGDAALVIDGKPSTSLVLITTLSVTVLLMVRISGWCSTSVPVTM